MVKFVCKCKATRTVQEKYFKENPHKKQFDKCDFCGKTMRLLK